MKHYLLRFKYDFLYEKVYKRMSKWFAGYDAINLDHAMTDWLMLRLLWLVKHSKDFPARKEFEVDGGYELWHETLWEICKGLACYRLIARSNWYFHLGEKRRPKVHKALTKRKDDALKLVVKYYEDLWD